MNYLLLQNKKILAIISGVMFAGIILHTASQKNPVAQVEANLSEGATITPSVSQAQNIVEEINPATYNPHAQHYIPNTEKVNKIKKYLTKRNSPLAEYAEEFVKAADEFGIDYRIVAAISIIESGGGKKNFRPYNAWGWGKSGFNSWTEGIWAVSKGIGKYYSKGATTPKYISKSYCPPNADNWARKVQGVMNEIGNIH